MHLSLFELWTVMGPFAKGVVLLLLGMSIASLATAVERWMAVRAAAQDLGRFEPEWRAVLKAPISPEARREAYDRSVRRTILATGSSLKKGLSVLATVGATAPFVGLVGTVMGIVNAFQQIATSEAGGVGKVSAGIAEALVTTAIGIGVAIPAVWLFNALTQRIGRVLTDLDVRAQDIAVTQLRGEGA